MGIISCLRKRMVPHIGTQKRKFRIQIGAIIQPGNNHELLSCTHNYVHKQSVEIASARSAYTWMSDLSDQTTVYVPSSFSHPFISSGCPVPNII